MICSNSESEQMQMLEYIAQTNSTVVQFNKIWSLAYQDQFKQGYYISAGYDNEKMF